MKWWTVCLAAALLLALNPGAAVAATGGGASASHVPCVARQASRGYPPGQDQRTWHMVRFGHEVVRELAYYRPCYLD